MRQWCDEAGLPHCSAHGLRKARAAGLASLGAPPHEIMAVTGHRTLKEVERYTLAANQRTLAEAAPVNKTVLVSVKNANGGISSLSYKKQ